MSNNDDTSLVISIDFDGTLCSNKWPDIGEPLNDVIEAVKEAQKMGVRFILSTCRRGQHLDDAVKWCKDMGIEFAAINENLKDKIDLYDGDCRKIGADFYIDDRAVRPIEFAEMFRRDTK